MLTQSIETFSCFESLSDPRRPFGNLQHSLFDIVVLALCGTICSGHDTIARVISRLDTAEFFECLQQWVDGLQLELKGCGVHIDGKTARHSFDNASNLKAMHMVSAWVDDASLCLGQVVTDQKSNEITAIPLLLEMLEIKGAVVTLDAMGLRDYGQEKSAETT